jgi:ribosomal protein S18 acetylase RimI-like enzyme
LVEQSLNNWLSKVKIRQARQEDLVKLEWNGELTHYRRLFVEVFRYAINGDAIMWLAELDEHNIVGQVFVQINSQRWELADGYGRAYVYGFRVKDDYRNQGLGSMMMDFVEADLIERGFNIISLNVSQDNEGARRLYERLGYSVIAPDPGRWSYIDDKGQIRHVQEPAWRMQKKLR